MIFVKNVERAARAREIILAYAVEMGDIDAKESIGDEQDDYLNTYMSDLLADFMHLCDMGPSMNFEDRLAMAHTHHDEEAHDESEEVMS